MKNYHILFAILITFSLAGCEKQDIESLSTDLTLKNVRIELEAQDVVRRASFTTEGKIRNVILGLISTSEYDDVKREYIYTEENLLECIPGFGPSDIPGCFPYLEYTGGVLATLNGNPLTYEGNIITELVLNHDNHVVYTFEDTSYDKLLKVEIFRDTSTTPYLFIEEIFGYEGDNLVSIEYRRLNDETGMLELATEIAYTYDNEKNPYLKTQDQTALVSYFQPMFYLNWNLFNLHFRSVNNVLTYSFKNHLSGFEFTESYTFEYNLEGYPVLRKHNLLSGDEVQTKYEYYE